MTPSTRLRWSFVIVIVSAVYAILIFENPQVASAVASWYVAVLLSIFVLGEIWRKP